MNEKILLVDDEETTLGIVGLLLQAAGYEVDARRGGFEALEAFARDPHSFDLVISDQCMESMSGVVLAKKLLQTRPGTPIVILTGDGETAKAGAEGVGIRGFVQKPVTIGQLVRSIDEALACPAV